MLALCVHEDDGVALWRWDRWNLTESTNLTNRKSSREQKKRVITSDDDDDDDYRDDHDADGDDDDFDAAACAAAASDDDDGGRDDDNEVMSEYERRRAENIEQNNAVLHDLGLSKKPQQRDVRRILILLLYFPIYCLL